MLVAGAHIALGFRVARLGRLFGPGKGKLWIPVHKLAPAEHHGQVELRLRAAQIRRLLRPQEGLGAVLHNAKPKLIAVGKQHHALGRARLGRPAVPVHGCCGILVHAKAVFEKTAHENLGLHIALFGQGLHKPVHIPVLAKIVGPGRPVQAGLVRVSGQGWLKESAQARHQCGKQGQDKKMFHGCSPAMV